MILDLYGLTIACRAESAELFAALVRPFRFFARHDGEPDIIITINEIDPPYDTFPPLKARFSTPRNIIYNDDSLKVIDYFGKGVITIDRGGTEYTVFSRDHNFLQEAFYLLVLSLFGQYCDRGGILRVHALALSYRDRAFIITAPPGGGKSTMMYTMMQAGKVKLISDDEPLYNKAGEILPFPLRMGMLNRESITSIPDKYIYKLNRMEFGPKYFVDCDYWRDRIETRRLTDSTLFITQRMLNGPARVEPASKSDVLRALIRDAVVGIGLYQGLEFIFSHSSWEAFSKIHVATKRLIRARRLVSTSQTYRLVLSRDIDENARVLEEFLDRT